MILLSGPMHLTSMTLKHLDDLTRLQIPDIDPHVFTPTRDMLPPGREVGEYAICSVHMAAVCLHTFRCLCIPQTNGGVLRACQDEFGVGREFDMRTSGCEQLHRVLVIPLHTILDCRHLPKSSDTDRTPCPIFDYRCKCFRHSGSQRSDSHIH